MDELELAHTIATVAHAGQFRADGMTPYVTHPERVAAIVGRWDRGKMDCDDLVAAAYLHDVLEDTKITSDLLIDLGVSPIVIAVVEKVTKPRDPTSLKDYYAAIAADEDAIILKCADRCSNLEDALDEVRAGRGIKRWTMYAEKTARDILPMLMGEPLLQKEIWTRWDALIQEIGHGR